MCAWRSPGYLAQQFKPFSHHVEPSTEVLLRKEGPFLPLGKPQRGKWLCHGNEEWRRQPPPGNASLASGFQRLLLLPLHPSTGWDRSCCFPLTDPHGHHTLKLLGVSFQSQLGCSTRLLCTTESQRKKGWKKEWKKNQSFTENMKGSGKKRLTGWFFHKYNPSKESICCLLTCENFLIKANHIRTVSDYFFVNLFHIHSLHGIATAQHPLLKAAQTHTFPWHSPTHQAHLR